MLGRKYRKYINFSSSIEKKLENSKIITQIRKFIDSFRFMLSSLSNLVDNLPEGLLNNKYRL